MTVLGVHNICANFHEFKKIHTFTFLASRTPPVDDHGKENVLGKHGHNETNQVLTICLMSTNVPQYKTSISIVICHSCLLIWCLELERKLASVQYLQIYILNTTRTTTQILAYLERAQKLIIWKKIQPSSSFLSRDMTVQTWWIMSICRGPFFAR